MFGWIIQHIIGNIPVWVWTFVAGGGAGAYFLSGFVNKLPWPQAKMLAMLVKYIGLAVFTAGVFMCGGAGVTAVYQDAVKEMENKIKIAEAKSEQANDHIKEVVQEKVKVIHDTQVIVQEKIKEDAAKMDAECKIDPVVITDLNQAAGGKKK